MPPNVHARITILTNGHLARNPRVLKEATTLGNAGYEVTVMGVSNHPPSVSLDESLVAGAPFRHQPINLLQGRRAWLRRAGVRLARDAARWGMTSIHTLGPANALLRAARCHPADLVIVHNEIAHWVGTKLLREGRKVAADFEDWHSEDLLPADRIGRPLGLLRRLEQVLVRTASYVTTTSEALASGLHDRYGGRRPEVITNSFELPHLGPAVPTRPRFVWFSQTVGRGRGLEEFLAAWARTTQDSDLTLLGEVSPAYAQQLLAQLPPAFRPRLQFHPLVPAAELPGFIAQHDIGLALEHASIANRDLTITNKILQYLGAGLAIVASDTAGQREVLGHAPDAGIIVALNDTDAFAASLEALLSDRSHLIQRRRAARQLAETHYCWEREGPRLVALVGDTLSARA